jgi:glycosyltransferase involved in cell wall biosynthesis
MHPILSIIVPTYNEEQAIEKTLWAIVGKLTEVPYELIVADDASTDRTAAIARRCGAIVSPAVKKTTIAAGKNRGASVARGKYLVFLDADVTVPEPNVLFRRALDCFKNDPQLVGLTVNLRVLPELATLADRTIFGLVNLTHRFNNNVRHAGSASGEFQMVRTDVFRKLGGYGEHLAVAEDNEFFARLARAGRTRFEPTLTVWHTGRRAHRIGWPRLLWQWFSNYTWVALFKRSAQKEWTEIR